MAHYFDDQPSVASDATVVDVALPDVAFTMTTDRGVFSHGHLDTGTSLLLRSAPAPASSGDLLDLGCGSGAIALTMALRSPGARVWAVDVNARALELTAANAARNGLAVRTELPDGVPEDVRFATIWSNPPIHVGKPALHALLERWLPRLAEDGVAHLVVQRHLGSDSLQKWINAQDWGLGCRRLSSSKSFRILEVRR